MKSNPQFVRTAIRCTLAALVTLLAGCASVDWKSKLTDQTVADLSIFAEKTIALLGSADPGISRRQTVLVREYLTGEEPALALHRTRAENAQLLLRAMANYSIDIALLFETVQDDEQRRLAYIETLSTFEQTVTNTMGLQELDLAANVTNAAAQPTLLDSMRAGQAVIDAFVRHGLQRLYEHDNTVHELAAAIADDIETDYAGLYEYARWINGHRDDVLVKLEELAVAEASGQSLVKEEEELIRQLQSIYDLEDRTEAHWLKYRATHRELDKVHIEALDASNRTRLILLVWARAHERMTSGRVREADWFTLEELGMFAVKYGISLL